MDASVDGVPSRTGLVDDDLIEDSLRATKLDLQTNSKDQQLSSSDKDPDIKDLMSIVEQLYFFQFPSGKVHDPVPPRLGCAASIEDVKNGSALGNGNDCDLIDSTSYLQAATENKNYNSVVDCSVPATSSERLLASRPPATPDLKSNRSASSPTSLSRSSSESSPMDPEDAILTYERLQNCQDFESLALWLTVARTSEIIMHTENIVQTTGRLVSAEIATMDHQQISELRQGGIDPHLRNQLDRLEERFGRDIAFRESVLIWLQEKAEVALVDTENMYNLPYPDKPVSLLIARVKNMFDFSRFVEAGDYLSIQRNFIEAAAIKEKAWVCLTMRQDYEIAGLREENANIKAEMEDLKHPVLPTKTPRGQEQPFNTYWLLIDKVTFLSLQRTPTTPSPHKSSATSETQASSGSTIRLGQLATIPDEHSPIQLGMPPATRKLRPNSDIPVRSASIGALFFPDAPRPSGKMKLDAATDSNSSPTSTKTIGQMQFGMAINPQSSPHFIRPSGQMQFRNVSGSRATQVQSSGESSEFANKRKAYDNTAGCDRNNELTRESPKRLQTRFTFSQPSNIDQENQHQPSVPRCSPIVNPGTSSNHEQASACDSADREIDSLFEDSTDDTTGCRQLDHDTDLEAAMDAEFTSQGL
ncbi:hypothetical protein B7463_g11007, partial [Scytalidium lignicola]